MEKHLFRVILITFLLIAFCSGITAKEAGNELFDKTLEELMSIKVISSSFTDIDKIKVPAAITVITKEEIAMSPARNINDLLETYVPGSQWMVHYDGPHPSVRGIVEERNFKILLLVNGKNMNQKIRNGATSELENWELADIEKIEIIRGPGSVIYGPGAIEAVINIITKSYSEDELSASLQTYSPYNSIGGVLSYSKAFSRGIKLFSFASITSTKGFVPYDGYYFAGNDFYGDLDYWQDTLERPLQDFFVDSDEQPQVKFHLQLDLGNNTSIWARYNNSGTTVNGITLKSFYQKGFDSLGFIYPYPGKYENFNETKDQHLTLAIDNIYEINKTTSLKTLLAFDSENSSRSQDYIQLHPLKYAPSDLQIMEQLQDPNSLRNRYFACTENELNLISILQKSFADNFSAALGIEYSLNNWTNAWFEPDYYLRLGDNWNILTDDKSPAYGFRDYFGTDSNDTYFVGDGWFTHTFSIFGETNYEPTEDLTVLLSGRLDKDSYSDWLFSPRFALIWEFFDQNYLKFIAQRSLRMNTAEELLILHKENNEPRSEELDNMEIIWTSIVNPFLICNFSAFVSNMEILSWNDPLRSTILSGNLIMWGLEFDIKYTKRNFDFIINHAYYKQIDWKLAPGIYESGISYSDYYKEYFGALLTDTGNDLNNVPLNTTKLAMNWRILPDLQLHVDSRLFWEFKGAQDGIDMMKAIIPYSSDSVDIRGIISLIEKYDTYGPDFRFNASLKYTFFDKYDVILYGMNLLDLTGNKRLRYDTGSKEEQYHYIMKNGLIIEPLTIGLRANIRI